MKKSFYETVSDELFEQSKPAINANLFGIDSYHKLKDVERALSSIRQTELLEDADKLLGLSYSEDIYSFSTLCLIHKHLFHDIYPWAGKIRAYDMRYESHEFTPANRLVHYGEQVFDNFKAKVEGGFIDEGEFVSESARFLNLINTLHPFPDGNGRTQRNMMLLHFGAHGFYLHWDRIHQWEIYATLKESFEQNFDPLERLIHKHLDKLENLA